MTGCQKWISVDLLWKSWQKGKEQLLLTQRNQRKTPFPPIMWREGQLYKCDLSGFVKLLCLEIAPEKPLTIRRFTLKTLTALLSIAVRFWLSLRNFRPFRDWNQHRKRRTPRAEWSGVQMGRMLLRSLHRPQGSTAMFLCLAALPCGEGFPAFPFLAFSPWK